MFSFVHKCTNLFPFCLAGWMRTTILSLMEWTSRTPFFLTLQITTACSPASSSFPTARLALRSIASLRNGRLRRTAGYGATQSHQHKPAVSLDKMIPLKSSISHSVMEKDFYCDSVVTDSWWLHTYFGGKSEISPSSLNYCGAQWRIQYCILLFSKEFYKEAGKLNKFLRHGKPNTHFLRFLSDKELSMFQGKINLKNSSLPVIWKKPCCCLMEYFLTLKDNSPNVRVTSYGHKVFDWLKIF